MGGGASGLVGVRYESGVNGEGVIQLGKETGWVMKTKEIVVIQEGEIKQESGQPQNQPCWYRTDSGTKSGDRQCEASSSYGWSSTTITSSACSEPGNKSGEGVPAQHPLGQAHNLERVGPEERPPRMGPLAGEGMLKVPRDHRL
ncbi:hypothetical protein Tco_0991406 [Tanacetum coccineum]|uniref:Uncharacterized protein n=1 Tax=Tanacetum coccineum TaxID=301880 RepID=A0ABQ5F0X1_9ASTR